MDSLNEVKMAPSGEDMDIRDENTFKILIATDIHLGFNDDSPARDDSFVTFEEILKIGRDENVDFVLLGGNLFHKHKPKLPTLQRAMEILRKYCLGSKSIEFEYLGDPAVDFPNQEEPEVNYQNPDINIAMPVFTIHGNQDDSIGVERKSAVDLFVAAKLLNHFGQSNDHDKITVNPVLLLKGETKLALYGLGYVDNCRLHILMKHKKVQFSRPTEDKDDWFNIFVLHQNRAHHVQKRFIPERFLPEFIDLAIWGHEHECRIEPEASTTRKTYTIQPGSSVVTSLIAGEAKEKFCGIVHVNRRRFRLEKIKLQTVRPFLFKEIYASEVTTGLPQDKNMSEAVEPYVEKIVKQMIIDSDELLTGHPKQPIEPLIHVQVFHEHAEERFDPVRFAQKFATEKVANQDIVSFKLKVPVDFTHAAW